MSQDDLGDLQFAIEEQGYSWEAGETSLSILQPEEQERRLGLMLVPEEMDRLAMAMADLPFVVFQEDFRLTGGARVVTTTLDAPVPGTKLAIRNGHGARPTTASAGDEQ